MWLEEQFSQQLGPGPDLSVAGVEGERLVWIKARGGGEAGSGREGRMETQAALQSVRSAGRGLTRYGAPFLVVHFGPSLHFARTIVKAAPEAGGQSSLLSNLSLLYSCWWGEEGGGG